VKEEMMRARVNTWREEVAHARKHMRQDEMCVYSRRSFKERKGFAQSLVLVASDESMLLVPILQALVDGVGRRWIVIGNRDGLVWTARRICARCLTTLGRLSRHRLVPARRVLQKSKPITNEKKGKKGRVDP
jgi:hypothetical protein